jgi:uncharacterized DUF497 family protein
LKRFYVFKKLHFYWDENKNVRNVQKHGISFQRACEVFFDPGLVSELAHDDGGGEVRAAIGYLESEPSLLYVVHIESVDNVIRLISARPANRKERQTYED